MEYSPQRLHTNEEEDNHTITNNNMSFSSHRDKQPLIQEDQENLSMKSIENRRSLMNLEDTKKVSNVAKMHISDEDEEENDEENQEFTSKDLIKAQQKLIKGSKRVYSAMPVKDGKRIKGSQSLLLRDDEQSDSIEEEIKQPYKKKLSYQNKNGYGKLQSDTSSLSGGLNMIKETDEYDTVYQPFKFDYHFEFDNPERVERLFNEPQKSFLRPNTGPRSEVSLRDRYSANDQITQIGDDQQSNLLQDNTISIFEVDVDELKKQKKKIHKEEKQFYKNQKKLKKRKEKEIQKTTDITSQKIDDKTGAIIKILEQKDLNSQKEFQRKEKILRLNFGQTVNALIKNIKIQRDLILQAYGPIVLQSKKDELPLFHINSKHNKDGAEKLNQLLKVRDNTPQPIQVKVVSCKNLKDKVGSGHFIMMCSVLDRIGGQKITYNLGECIDSLRDLSRSIRDFNLKKRTFINKEHREMEQKLADGQKVVVAAPKTGMNWFKAGGFGGYNKVQQDDEDEKRKKAEAKQNEIMDQSINPNTDVKLEFSRNQTKYIRFDGRYFDNELLIDDHLNILVPPNIQPSNILQFELILLASETVPKDYVVGWGVFPLVNSEFMLNEGQFKLPMLFGQVNIAYDKFGKIEESFKKDLDNWLCNLYIEIDRIKLSEIKIHPETSDLYHYEPYRLKNNDSLISDTHTHINPHIDEIGENSQMLEYKVGKQQKFFKKQTFKEIEQDENDSLLNYQKLKNKQLNLASNSNSQISVEDQEVEDKKSQSNKSQSIEDQSNNHEHEESKNLNQSKSKESYYSTVSHEIMIDRRKDDDEIQYDQFHFSVSQKLDLKTRKLTFKKMLYIWDELTEDFGVKKLKNIEFHLAIIYMFFLFFLRMWTHYVGQYIILLLMGVPVTGFDPHWYKIYITYAQWTFIQELMVVVFGILSNSLLMSLFTLIAFFCKRSCLNCFPRMFYKVICWYGIWTLFDPYVTLVIDIASEGWDVGDYFKLYNYYYKKQGNGLVGIYLTVFAIFAFTVINGLIFYNYMIFVHMNGRILDLYKRLSGSIKAFFIPHDNEVSLTYLKWVIKRAKKRNFVIKSSSQSIVDKRGQQKDIQYIHIYKYGNKSFLIVYIENSALKRNRMFVKDQDGSICEVPQNKILLREDEVKVLIEDINKSNAHIYGDKQDFFESLKLSVKNKDNVANASILAERHGYSARENQKDREEDDDGFEFGENHRLNIDGGGSQSIVKSNILNEINQNLISLDNSISQPQKHRSLILHEDDSQNV
ncbi:uncharacterized protein loc101675906 [Stylonychia lemnae]|uniref:Uncharacterized protein loc101675906 n=1 Tax=Stylonychia lemnae TaxID=5949 RepID=A0A077ZRB6_STYLE|nr:uncharacterized protein loc101675906 [Stylonychia lemnae]|eukprot:CDW72463.1 uncharacterized protein loc101675906 [Stylonychia lemnae]